MSRSIRILKSTVLVLVLGIAAQQALAQPGIRNGREPRPPAGHVERLPSHAREIHVHRDSYWYRGGIFYSPGVRGYDVVRAPIGAWVEVLPRGYHRVRVGLNLYYVFNNDYYRWDPARRVYVVVQEPAGSSQDADVADNDGSKAPAAPVGEMIFYPKKGQSDEQLGKDRYECHLWAYKQSGFDPSLADPDQDGTPGDYRRAMAACMEGRDYVVK